MVTRATAAGIDRSGLADQLKRWVGRGLISPEQAERILAEEQQPAERPAARASLVAEALGYVGGVLILIGAVSIAGRYWSDIGRRSRARGQSQRALPTRSHSRVERPPSAPPRAPARR